jgi:hypothetical protein
LAARYGSDLPLFGGHAEDTPSEFLEALACDLPASTTRFDMRFRRLTFHPKSRASQPFLKPRLYFGQCSMNAVTNP